MPHPQVGDEKQINGVNHIYNANGQWVPVGYGPPPVDNRGGGTAGSVWEKLGKIAI